MLFIVQRRSALCTAALRGLVVEGLVGAVVVGALAAVGCSPPSSEVGLDADGDHVIDSLGRTLDKDGDGIADQYDIDGDGVLDGVGIDTNADGEFDGIGLDTDGDGLIDAVDTDGDGLGDIFANPDRDNGTDGGISFGTGGSGGVLDKPAGNFCDEFEVNFEPKTPTVYLLVDRSGSMGATQEDFWTPLRDGILPAVQELQGDVRFGFGTYTSTMSSQCLEPTSVLDDLGTIELNNYDAIAGKYTGYSEPNGGDTPTSAALHEAAAVLGADASPGDQFIVLVTDGNPDFCDNGNVTCPQDATIGALQDLFQQGIRTLVFGLEAKQYPIDSNVMQSFANAGDGQPVDWSKGVGNPDQGGVSTVENECGGTKFGTYSDVGGSADAFLTTDPAALVTQLKTTVSGLKSCQIALNFQVKDSSVGQIFVDDKATAIPSDQWGMVGDNVIELKGASCDKWQAPEVDYFFAGFPCTAIIR